MLRVSLPVMILALIATTVAAQPLMTLEQAITIGLENNYDIRIARNQAAMSNNNKGLGTAGFLPTLNASAGYSRSDSHQDIDPPPTETDTDTDNLSAELSLSWTIFDGFGMFTNRARYNELARQGEYRARGAIENSVVAISRAYFDLVRQEQLLAVARDTRDISQIRLDRERTRNELGGASSTDLLNARVALNNDQTDLLDQQLQIRIAREQLNILLGRGPADPVTVDPDIALPPFDLTFNEVLTLAREQNASLKTNELDKRVAELDVSNARTSFLPRLSAFASYDYSDQTRNSSTGASANIDLTTETTSSTIGLQASWNLFNGRRDQINLANAKIAANNQALRLIDARNRLNADVSEAYKTYQQRLELVILNEQNIEAAQQNLELQRERYQLGAATSLEFRDAQVSLAQVRTALISARYQARISIVELDRLMGRLITEL